MQNTGLLIFSGALPIIAGLLMLLLGLILTYNLDGLLLLLTHTDTPSYIKDKPEVVSVKTFIKGVGNLLLILGVGLIVYGVISIGSSVF